MNEERYFRLQHMVLWLAVALAIFVIVQCLRELHKIQDMPIDYSPPRVYPRVDDEEYFEALLFKDYGNGKTSNVSGQEV